MRSLLVVLLLLCAGCARAPSEWAFEIDGWCAGTLSYDGPPEELSGFWQCTRGEGAGRLLWQGPVWGEMPDARRLRLVFGTQGGGGIPVLATIHGDAASAFTGTAGGAAISAVHR